MNVLVLGPDHADARFNDLDYALMFERYGSSQVCRLDPSSLYQKLGMGGMETEIARFAREKGITTLVYALGSEFDFRPEFIARDLAHLFRVLILGDDEIYFE